MAVSNLQLVTELYIAYFNRAPDPAGLNAWIADLNAGATITQVANAFANSGEAKALYPFLTINSIPDQASAAGFVNAVYNNLLNRAPEGTIADKTTGLGYWTDQLDTGKVTPGQFILAVVQSVNQQTGTADAATLANKVTVADFFETTVANLNAQFSLAAATAAIAGVNGTAASVTAAEAAITATIARNVFTLTAGTDTIVDNSGLGHDVVNAPLVIGILGAQTQSINVGDQITLSGDNNTANITLGSTIGSTSWPAGSVLNLGTGVANTLNITNVGSILPVPGILPGLIPGNDIIGANIINDVNSVADVAILGAVGVIGTSGLMTVPSQINMNNTTTTALFVQVDTTKLTGAETANLSVQGVGIVKPGVPAAEGSEGTLFGGLSVGSNVPATPGFGTFNLKVTGNNAVALGTNGATAAPNLVVTGTGNLQLASIVTAPLLGDTGAEFQRIKTIDTTGVTGNVSISGAGGEIGGKAVTELFGVNGFLASAGGGVVGAGNLALTSVTMGNGNNFLDISQGTLANFNATGLTVKMGTGTNELVVDDTVAQSVAPVTFYSGVTTLGIANAGAAGPIPPAKVDTYNLANLGVNSIALFGDGTMAGAIAITKAGDKFALDVGSADTAGFAISVTSSTPGSAFTSNISLGTTDFDADATVAPSTGEFATVGLLTLTGFGTDNIASLGGPQLGLAAAANVVNGILATDATIAPITVNVTGNAVLDVTAAAGGAGAVGKFGFNPSYAAGGVGQAFALVETGNGTFFTDTDTAVVGLEGNVRVASIDATTSGGLQIDGINTANQGTIGVLVKGSATGANFLTGSFGNDVISSGAGGGAIVTEGGGDTITLAAHAGKAEFIDLFVGSAAPTTVFAAGAAGPAYAAIAAFDVAKAAGGEAAVNSAGAAVVVAAGDALARDGFWGVAPGGPILDLTQSASFGTSADATTITGFNVATDTINISVGGWTQSGPVFGLEQMKNTFAAAGGQLAEATGPGATVGLGAAGAATILELGAGGGNAGLANPPLFANAAAVAAQLQTDNYHLTFANAVAAAGSSTDYLIAYQNATGDTVIADLNLISTKAGAVDFGTDFVVHVSDMAVLKGVALAGLAINTAASLLHSDIVLVA